MDANIAAHTDTAATAAIAATSATSATANTMSTPSSTIPSKTPHQGGGLSRSFAKGHRQSKAICPTSDKLLRLAATALDCTSDELQAWFDQIPSTPPAVVQNGLRLMNKYHLNPFDEELAIYRYDDGHW